MTHINGDGEILLEAPAEANYAASIVEAAPPRNVESSCVDLVTTSLREVSKIDPSEYPISLSRVVELGAGDVEEDKTVDAVGVVLGSMRKIRTVERPPKDTLRVFARYFLGEIQPDRI